METAALCKPIQRFADLLRIPGTWVLTGLGQLLAALGSFPHCPQPLRLLHTHLYWRFLECQSIEVTLTQNGHLTHHEIPSVASLRPGGHFPRIGWPVSPEYAVFDYRAEKAPGKSCVRALRQVLGRVDIPICQGEKPKRDHRGRYQPRHTPKWRVNNVFFHLHRLLGPVTTS